MSEFCLECYQKYCQPEDLNVAAVKLSDATELCEGRGQFKCTPGRCQKIKSFIGNFFDTLRPAMSKIPVVPFDVWRTLYDAARRFRELEPWKSMDDDHSFAVRLATSNETRYCAFMGSLGELYGLAIYRRDGGIEHLKRLLAGEYEADRRREWAHHQDCLTIEYVSKSALDDEDRKVIGALGVRFKGKRVYPQFRSYIPGHSGWYIDEIEAKDATVALRCASYYVEQFRKDPLTFTSGDPDRHPLFERSEGDGWTIEWTTWPDVPPVTPVEVVVDVERLDRIRKKDYPQRDVWEAGHFYMSSAIHDRDRPYLGRVAVLIDEASQFALNSTMLTPEQEPASILVNLILDTIEKVGTNPLSVAVEDKPLGRSMEKVMAAIGIHVDIRQTLHGLGEFRQGIREHVSSGGTGGQRR